MTCDGQVMRVEQPIDRLCECMAADEEDLRHLRHLLKCSCMNMISAEALRVNTSRTPFLLHMYIQSYV